MALAITTFQAPCGFWPLSEIASYLNNVPKLRALLPPSVIDAFPAAADSPTPTGPAEESALRGLFLALMTAEESDVRHQIKQLIARFGAGDSGGDEDVDVVKVVLRLNSQSPGDIGIFCPFLLNYAFLQPGEARTGKPHTYITGECIECMANCDNVIRASLTPKLRDIPNLVSTLTYISAKPTAHIVNARPLNSSVATLYDPPVLEFIVMQVRLYSGSEEYHEDPASPSSPRARRRSSGDVGDAIRGAWECFLCRRRYTDHFVNVQSDRDLVIYRASVEVN